MNFSEVGISCSVCGGHSMDDTIKLPSITFNNLQGEPSVCERCISAKLGLTAEWASALADKIVIPPPVVPAP